jgi:hypothetical protein
MVSSNFSLKGVSRSRTFKDSQKKASEKTNYGQQYNPGDKSCKTYNDEEHLTNNTILSTMQSPHMLMYVE